MSDPVYACLGSVDPSLTLTSGVIDTEVLTLPYSSIDACLGK